MPTVTTADLRERVDYQQSTKVRDEFNAVKETWTTAATVWASVREVSSREQIAAGRPAQLSVYDVWIRVGGLVPNHKEQLIWRTKALLIETVTVLQADGMIHMRCQEITL
jgi:head-tail adaptor